MQKFKRFLIKEQSQAPKEQGSSVWATSKDLPGRKHVVLLNVGKKQVAVIAYSPKMYYVHVPDMDFEEVCEPANLSRDAMKIIKEIETYIH